MTGLLLIVTSSGLAAFMEPHEGAPVLTEITQHTAAGSARLTSRGKMTRGPRAAFIVQILPVAYTRVMAFPHAWPARGDSHQQAHVIQGCLQALKENRVQEVFQFHFNHI